MHKYSPLLAIGFAVLAIPRPLHADPVTLVSSSRAISVSATAGDTSTGTTSMFDQDVLSNSIGAVDSGTGQSLTASSFLSSFVSAGTGTFGGHGTTSTSQNSSTVPAGGHAQANYFVGFDLNATRRFDFGATFTGTGGNATNQSIWESQLFYFPNGPSPLTAFNFSGTGSRILSVTDTLSPGRYGFFVNAVSNSFDRGVGSTGLDYTFSLKFSDPQGPAPVPEPASLLLLGTGLAAIAGRRKLQSRSSSRR
jgi:hypothetical protein